MSKFIRRLRDTITIWLICRFNIALPDLQQTDCPRFGPVYYYYGRWFRLVRHDRRTVNAILRRIKQRGLINRETDEPVDYSDLACRGCHLRSLGIPCKKVNPITPEDLCLRGNYRLIKGKRNDYQKIQP